MCGGKSTRVNGVSKYVANYRQCILYSYSKLTIAHFSVALASAAPRIEKLNLASLQPDNIPFKPFTNKISGFVMFLAWHPEEEDKLAFATNEGRVGVLDTSSMSNVPVIMKPFINKEVYALHWCFLTNDKQERRLVLFACGTNELAYYHMSGAHKYGKHWMIICFFDK